MQVVGMHTALHCAWQTRASFTLASRVPSGTRTVGASAQNPGGVPDGGQAAADQPVTRTPIVVPGCTPPQLGACARKKARSASGPAMALSTARQAPQKDPAPPSLV